MRFRHIDPAPIIAFLRETSPAILVREWERERSVGGVGRLLGMASLPKAANAAQPGQISDVEFIAGRGKGPQHVGNVLRFYFHINSSSPEPILPLVEAVAHVEGRAGAGEFLLAGHPDGGLISVSRERLPFQQGEPITWWGP